MLYFTIPFSVTIIQNMSSAKDEVSVPESTSKLLNLPTSSESSIEESSTDLELEVPSSTSGNIFLMLFIYNVIEVKNQSLKRNKYIAFNSIYSKHFKRRNRIFNVCN